MKLPQSFSTIGPFARSRLSALPRPIRTLASAPTRLLSALGFLIFAATGSAQTMPQDNWRYDGLQFSSPVTTNQLRSIAIGSGGVYVGEVFSGSNPNRVLQFTEAGVFIRRFTDTFGYILGLACDAAGNVYVLDRTSSNVKMYDASGNFIRQWGSAGSADGQFSIATATDNTMIAVSGKTGEIFVCDPGNTRVQVFNSSGAFLRKWGQLGSLPGQFYANTPIGITVTDSSRVCVLSNYSQSSQYGMKVFDANGIYATYADPTFPYAPTTIASSKDGLVFAGSTSSRNIVDPRFASVGSPPFNVYYGAAFTDKGYIFAITSQSTKVSIAYREYTNAINFTAPTAIPHPQILGSVLKPRTGSKIQLYPLGV